MGVAAGFGSLWINTHRGGQLYRVDPKSNHIVATIQVDDCCGVPVVGDGRLWAGTSIIDPTTNRVVGTLPTGVLGVFAITNGVAWGFSATGLVSIDPRTYRPVRTFKVDANARRVSDPEFEGASGDGALWVIVVGDSTQTFGGVVVKIDPRDGRVLHTYRPPDPGGDADIQFYQDAVWLKGDDSGRLVKLDAGTGASRTYELPGWQALSSYYPQAIGLGYGDLWIRNSTDKIVRFRPSTGHVVASYPASATGNGGYPAIAFGSLWAPNFDDDTVWRDRLA